MKNKIGDLRDHMFAALERLGCEDMTEEDLKKEIARSQAISELGKVLVESAKTELMYAKLTGRPETAPLKYLDVEKPKLEHPKAQYTNKQHNY